MSTTRAAELGLELPLPLPFPAAVAAVQEALKAEGFGVLTDIDLQAAFREKLGKTFREFRILGACNPPLAYEAVSADPQVALLLPCNVTVEAEGPSACRVRLTNPEALLGAGPAAPRVREVARDAGRRMERVHRALQARYPFAGA